MAKYPNVKLTQKGLDMAISADKSKKVIYTHIGIGDGKLGENENILMLTEMKSRKIFANITDINNDSKNQVTLETIVSNKVVDQEFYAREIGIYAKFGNNGQEVLYAYANAGDKADHMPSKEQPLDELKLKITLIVGNVDNVTAIINSSIIFITLADCRREIARHNADPTAHGDFARKKDYYTKLETDAKLNGKANTNHGLHVPTKEQANNTRFLRNDNTWQNVTPQNIGAPTKTGIGATGTWGINISGKANTAGVADGANVLRGDKSLTNQIHLENNEQNKWIPVIVGDSFQHTLREKIKVGAAGIADVANAVEWNNIRNRPSAYTPISHNHDNLYPSLHGARATGTWGINISGKANTAGVADNAHIADRVGNDVKNMRFHWTGQNGQPTWLWGGNDSENMYVYNPVNLNVNNARKFEGRTFAQAKSEMQTQISVLTGTIAHGGTIPLPNGYTEAQCKWFVSMKDDNPENKTWDVLEDDSVLNYKMECYTQGRKVVCRSFHHGERGGEKIWVNGIANYIIIGVK